MNKRMIISILILIIYIASIFLLYYLFKDNKYIGYIIITIISCGVTFLLEYLIREDKI